jgi:hypothetical protein
MNEDYVTYEEITPWPPWVALGIALVCLVPAAVLGREALDLAGGGGVGQAVGVALAVGTPIVLWVLMGRMRVRVTRTALVLGFGFVSLVRRTVPLTDVVGMEPVDYSPLAEFGGWGIRWGRGGKRAWTIRGRRALRLELRYGKLLYVGTETPERLAERIRVAGGMHGGGAV